MEASGRDERETCPSGMNGVNLRRLTSKDAITYPLHMRPGILRSFASEFHECEVSRGAERRGGDLQRAHPGAPRGRRHHTAEHRDCEGGEVEVPRLRGRRGRGARTARKPRLRRPKGAGRGGRTACATRSGEAAAARPAPPGHKRERLRERHNQAGNQRGERGGPEGQHPSARGLAPASRGLGRD